jgi:uncharacterized membrane protein YadS
MGLVLNVGIQAWTFKGTEGKEENEEHTTTKFVPLFLLAFLLRPLLSDTS